MICKIVKKFFEKWSVFFEVGKGGKQVESTGVQTFHITGEKTYDTSQTQVKIFRLCYRTIGQPPGYWPSDPEEVTLPDLAGRKSVEFNLAYSSDDLAVPYYASYGPMPVFREGTVIRWTNPWVLQVLSTEIISFIYE